MKTKVFVVRHDDEVVIKGWFADDDYVAHLIMAQIEGYVDTIRYGGHVSFVIRNGEER